MSEKEDASAISRRLCREYDETYGPPGAEDGKNNEDRVRHAEVCVVDAHGHAYRAPEPGLSARQKLDWANKNAPCGRTAEPPVTPGEMGVSPAELQKLSPARKLELANVALARRANSSGNERGSKN